MSSQKSLAGARWEEVRRGESASGLARGLLGGLCAAWALAAWAWLGLHLALSFSAALREERDLFAEAAMLLDSTVCSLPRTLPMGGSLARCDEARAVMRRWAVASASERVLRDVLHTSLSVARRELTSMALFGGGALLGLVLLSRCVGTRLAAEAWAAALARRERESISAMRREKWTTVVPLAEHYTFQKED